jgi:hypothetical protein
MRIFLNQLPRVSDLDVAFADGCGGSQIVFARNALTPCPNFIIRPDLP